MDRTLTDHVVVQLAGEVTPTRAEEVDCPSCWDQEGSFPVTIDLSRYPSIATGAGWRIGNALRRFSGVALEVTAPPLGAGDWFRDLNRSGLAYSLAVHAGKIQAGGADLSTQFRNLYNGIGRKTDEAFAFFGEVHRGMSVNPEREDLFRDDFVGALRSMRVQPADFGRQGLRPDQVRLKATQKYFDHASRKPFRQGVKVASSLLLERAGTCGDHPDPTGRLKGYVRRTSGLFGWRMTELIRVRVADNEGRHRRPAIAERHRVRGTAFDKEVPTVAEALNGHTSIKGKARSGLPHSRFCGPRIYLHECGIWMLRAFATLRTGRLIAVLDGSNHSKGFQFVGDELGYMPGTTLEVLVPVTEISGP